MTRMTIAPVPVGVFPSTTPGDQIEVGVLVFTPEQWALDVRYGVEAVTSEADQAIRAAEADGWKAFESSFAYDEDDHAPDLDGVLMYRPVK